MAGFPSFTCGIVKGVTAFIPIDSIARSTLAVIPQGDRNWLRLVTSTGQSSLLNADNDDAII